MSRSGEHRQSFRFALGILVVGAAVLVVAPATAQHEHPDRGGEAFAGAQMPYLSSVLGTYSRPITTTSPAAQAYFDQGMQMVYAFTYSVAISSFQEAQRQDPSCAMCYWGEALARGPMLNAVMSNANAGPAFTSAQKALSLIDEAKTSTEKALIQAMAARYAETHGPETRAPLDSAYARAMGEVYRVYPSDLDVATLYAESLMLLNPARAFYRTEDPFVQSFHRVLEAALAQDITHPGACHLYIHGTEATSVAYRAEPCADILMTSVPGASHLNHMPSHTYNVLGQWGKAVRSNILAWHSDQRTEYGEGVSYAGTHNLHMLFFAASMDGQGALAASAAKEYARQVNGGSFYHAMVLFRFGQFDDILEMSEIPEQPLQRGLWDFSRGYAHLRTGAGDSASYYLARVDEATSTIPESVTMRNHPAPALLGIVGDILRGELLRSEGRMDEATAAFQRAVEQHDGLRYDEPEPLNFSSRHWLGAHLLEIGKTVEAESVYRESLVKHPNNGWSFFGLEQALRAQGRMAEAEEARARFAKAWDRADTVIRSSRF